MVTASDLLGDEDFVQECANPSPGVLVLVCTVGEVDDDEPRSRVIVLRGDAWLDLMLEGDVFASIDADEHGQGFVLGRRGTVARFDWRALTSAQLAASCALVPNPRAASAGPLRRVRIVGSGVYAVGTRGQVFRMRGDAFEALPRIAMNGEELHATDIAGTGPDDLVVITLEGVGARFDGTEWHFLDLPTSGGLNSICRLRDGKYVIVGYNAAVLMGSQDHWEVVRGPAGPKPYFGVAASDAMVFLSSLGGVDVFDGVEVRTVVPSKRGTEFVFLRSGPDGVWSASGKSIGLLTPAGWVPLTR